MLDITESLNCEVSRAQRGGLHCPSADQKAAEKRCIGRLECHGDSCGKRARSVIRAAATHPCEFANELLRRQSGKPSILEKYPAPASALRGDRFPPLPVHWRQTGLRCDTGACPERRAPLPRESPHSCGARGVLCRRRFAADAAASDGRRIRMHCPKVARSSGQRLSASNQVADIGRG